jgi:hypothetical protein
MYRLIIKSLDSYSANAKIQLLNGFGNEETCPTGYILPIK